MTGLKPVATKAKSEEEEQRLAPVKGAATKVREESRRYERHGNNNGKMAPVKGAAT
jgi:hypothetical protein